MSNTLSTVVTDLIASYGNTSRNVINAYRTGGERVIDYVEQRWDQALEQSSDKLSAEVRDNAAAAQKLFGSFNAQGLALATNSAEDRKSTRLNSSHHSISYAVFCLK